ncbi:MAG: hypothetical protein M1834_004272 [Cirrosporium novae-zelandiae]|nr:MAG: hypothetical protein M1834_004272 [Cirrosporium novae-zelandiae]
MSVQSQKNAGLPVSLPPSLSSSKTALTEAMLESGAEFPGLSSLGLYAANIRGDGNCLFNAFSDQLYGTETRSREIRTEVIKYLSENSEYYKPFLDTYPTRRNPKRKNVGALSDTLDYQPTKEQIERQFQRHLEQMSKTGVWGDNLEISAFASCYQVVVKVYQEEDGHPSYYVPPRDGVPVTRGMVQVAYHGWEHYSSIRNINGPHSGIPNAKISNDDQEAIDRHSAKFPTIEPWMTKAVATAVKHLSVDAVAIDQALRACNYDVDNAVSRLIEMEECGSVGSTPGSSSVEREYDSDEEYMSGPAKRQDRRVSRATRLTKENSEPRKKLSPKSKIPKVDAKANEADGTDDQTKSEGTQIENGANTNDDATSTHPRTRSSSKQTASAPENSGNETTIKPKIRLRLTQPRKPDPEPELTAPKTRSKQTDPKQKRVPARVQRDMKKTAQKQAAKERRREAASAKTGTCKSTEERKINSQEPNKMKPKSIRQKCQVRRSPRLNKPQQ